MPEFICPRMITIFNFPSSGEAEGDPEEAGKKFKSEKIQHGELIKSLYTFQIDSL